jgi:hypothetical protein
LSAPPRARLGRLSPDGIAPAVLALVERGLERRPRAVDGLRGEVELRFVEGYAPVRLAFSDGEVVVEDGGVPEPDLVVTGSLPDIIHLAVVPSFGGVPRSWRAIGALATGKVRLDGERALGRRLLALLRLTP